MNYSTGTQMKKKIFLFLMTFSMIHANTPNACDTLAANPGNEFNPSGIKGIDFEKINVVKAIKACKQACKDFPDESRYSYQLGRVYHKKKDYKTALDLYTKAAKQGDIYAKYKLVHIYHKGEIVDRNDTKSFNIAMDLAKQGQSGAQGILGMFYSNGIGVKKDYKEAFKWFMKSAKQGHVLAQSDLGEMYYYGRGVKKNVKEAIYWYTKAAEQNNISAQTKLARIYYIHEEGIYKDHKKAFKWYMRAAKEGDSWAHAMVGLMYYEGDGVKQDYNKALEWYLKSISEGKDSSGIATRIAKMYEKGMGTKKDYSEAFKWYLKSAKEGSPDSENKVGDMYKEGMGTKKDYKKAFEWYLKFTENSSYLYKAVTKTFIKIGNMYEKGEGVKKNYMLALEWYLKASDTYHREEAKKGVVQIENMYNNGNYNNKKDAAKIAFRMGRLYDRGTLTYDEREKAFSWYMKSAKYGHAKAQAAVASEYELGIFIEKDLKEAIRWYLKAAKQGNAFAQYSLGDIFYTKKDYKKAFEWYILSINNDDRKSAFTETPIFARIGEMYYIGKGIGKNYQKALQWYMKAAKSENADAYAQYSIGHMYDKGQGVKKNYIIAYAWYNLSSSNGFDASKYINILEQKLTQNQIIIAQNYDPLKNFKSPQKKKSTKNSSGTGFFINQHQILTNNHVVKECKNIELIRKGYKSYATVVVKDVINDLAILETQKKNNTSLYFRGGKGIRVGDNSIVIGYPLGALLGSSVKVTTGNISAMTGLLNNTSRLQLTAPVQPGNSGGPLLDESGNIVGIVVARLKKEQNVNLAIKSNIAQMFLDINNIDYDVTMSKDAKDVADIVNKTKESIVQVVCYQ